MTYEKNLVQIGLSEGEALVYDAVLTLGKTGIKELAKAVPLKRTNIYALLYALKNKGLVSEIEERGKKKFLPKTPEKLREFVVSAEEKVRQSKSAIEDTLPLLRSQFNLVTGKPTVRFFEGREGLVEVLKDSLTSETEILQYVGSDIVYQLIPKENDEYVRKRLALGIKKRYITPDNPKIREDAKKNTDLTEARVISSQEVPFTTLMMIYDNKISYLNMLPDRMIGIIVQDPMIYEMHRDIFEELWKHATPVGPIKPLASHASQEKPDVHTEQTPPPEFPSE